MSKLSKLQGAFKAFAKAENTLKIKLKHEKMNNTD
jgi:hypothetical protein